MDSENACQQTEKTLIRLLLQKQSNLGLPCLSRPFWQVTIVFEVLGHFLYVLCFIRYHATFAFITDPIL